MSKMNCENVNEKCNKKSITKLLKEIDSIKEKRINRSKNIPSSRRNIVPYKRYIDNNNKQNADTKKIHNDNLNVHTLKNLKTFNHLIDIQEIRNSNGIIDLIGKDNDMKKHRDKFLEEINQSDNTQKLSETPKDNIGFTVSMYDLNNSAPQENLYFSQSNETLNSWDLLKQQSNSSTSFDTNLEKDDEEFKDSDSGYKSLQNIVSDDYPSNRNSTTGLTRLHLQPVRLNKSLNCLNLSKDSLANQKEQNKSLMTINIEDPEKLRTKYDSSIKSHTKTYSEPIININELSEDETKIYKKRFMNKPYKQLNSYDLENDDALNVLLHISENEESECEDREMVYQEMTKRLIDKYQSPSSPENNTTFNELPSKRTIPNFESNKIQSCKSESSLFTKNETTQLHKRFSKSGSITIQLDPLKANQIEDRLKPTAPNNNFEIDIFDIHDDLDSILYVSPVNSEVANSTVDPGNSHIKNQSEFQMETESIGSSCDELTVEITTGKCGEPIGELTLYTDRFGSSQVNIEEEKDISIISTCPRTEEDEKRERRKQFRRWLLYLCALLLRQLFSL